MILMILMISLSEPRHIMQMALMHSYVSSYIVIISQPSPDMQLLKGIPVLSTCHIFRRAPAGDEAGPTEG